MQRKEWLPLLPHSDSASSAEHGTAPASLKDLEVQRDAAARAWRRARRLLEEIRRRDA